VTTVFADTSCLLALLIPTDSFHLPAITWASANRLPMITSEYVLMEVGNFFSPIPMRHVPGPFWRAIQSDGRIQVVEASVALMTRGIDLFDARLDKTWSLTDCISFVVMKDQGINSALTADHHSMQAGFTSLLSQA
jgi:uncharacterized protein